MYEMKNFQTLADLSKNYYSFFNITRNIDCLKAIFSYLINGPFQQIKLYPVSQVPRKENIFCSSALVPDNECEYLLLTVPNIFAEEIWNMSPWWIWPWIGKILDVATQSSTHQRCLLLSSFRRTLQALRKSNQPNVVGGC